MKTINNTQLTKDNINQEVTLYGWVSKKRNLGGMIFIDLRDRSGIIQLVIKPEDEFYTKSKNLKTESVIKVTGIVKERENINESLATGNIEVIVNELVILNTSKDLPFDINDATKSLEDTRLKYRYLDLRRNELYNNFKTRHQITMATRNYLNENGFIEVETPILCKSTPEGARDYLVPSRISKGKFYALPQSPQLFKQLLMVSGFEKYFQIAKCFRDEDLRADRQPEFTQIDIEMSFIDEKDILTTGENLVAKIFKDVKNIDIQLPLKRMTYQNAIDIYGTDKPDLRFELPIIDLNDIFKETNISFLENKIINGLLLKNNSDNFSRKEIDKLTEYVKTFGASSIIYLKYNDNELSGSIVNNMSDEEKNNLIETLKLENNDIVFIIADNYNIVKKSLGALRLKLGKDLNLINTKTYELLWVIDFPLFEYDEKNKSLTAVHHPFTSPKELNAEYIRKNPEKLLSKAYDIVINGYEAGGGSIRIHDNEIQTAIFDVIGLSKNEIEIKFGWFVEALKYGTPPHGGIALGLDRLTMLLCETDNIRDIIAFPKTANANCLMSESPSTVDLIQLDELGIKIK